MRKQMLIIAAGLVLLLLTGCLPVAKKPASLSVSPALLDFGADAEELLLVIANSGDGELNWEIEVVQGAEWLSASPAAGTNQGTVTVAVEREGLEAGEYAGELKITSNGGNQNVPVALSAKEKEPPAARPGRVENLDVRGFTMPAKLGADSMLASAQNLKALIAEADQLLPAAGGRGGLVEQASLPAGYTAVFVLSWDPLPSAASYTLFRELDGEYRPVREIPLEELEDPEDPAYIFKGSFSVGEIGVFKVQAANAAGAGEASEADSGVIIGAQRLFTPANGSTAPAEPNFVWERHPEGTGYILTVARGDLSNHIWEFVVEDANQTELKYGGKSLLAGGHLWYVLTQGPAGSGKADAYSLSEDWMFAIE